MAKKKGTEDELIVDVEEVYSKTETFIEENRSALMIAIGIVIVIIGGYLGYNNFYLAPLEAEAQEEMFQAEFYFEQDSLQKAIYGDGINYLGFEEIADQYGATKSGNLAHYYLGISYLRLGQYESAIENLKAFDGNGNMIEAVATGAIGDAYAELGDMSKAVDYYMDAAGSFDNEFSTPIYLMRAARANEKMGNIKDAVELYNRIKDDYKKSGEAAEVEKYISRAEAKLNS